MIWVVLWFMVIIFLEIPEDFFGSVDDVWVGHLKYRIGAIDEVDSSELSLR